MFQINPEEAADTATFAILTTLINELTGGDHNKREALLHVADTEAKNLLKQMDCHDDEGLVTSALKSIFDL